MTDKTALVVGASRGIGLGLVKELVGRGWKVIATRRSPKSDKGLQVFADASNGKVLIEPLDMEDFDQIDALAKKLCDAQLDLVFVNAGIGGSHEPLPEVTREDVTTLFVTNVLAPVKLAQALEPRVKDGGTIALMTSGLGSVGADFHFGMLIMYPASKAALNKLTRDWTVTLDAGRKLTVLSMSPGWVKTDLGGQNAMITVEESAKGCIDVVEAKAGTGQHGFYGHNGEIIPW